jgi:DNA-binding response OmpR family regulator
MTKKKILIIDDDVELGEEMVEVLEDEGCSVDISSNGPKGVKLILENTYDVFLLDFKMQGITGIDLLKEIRNKDPEAAVFFVSGKPGLEAILEAENLSRAINGIIEKPFDLQFLLEKIKACPAPVRR